MSDAVLIGRYAAFAVIATLANLATQRLILSRDEGPFAFQLALIAGTLAGLVVKYGLDKRWIFADSTRGLAAHGRRFSLYSLMGVATTLIFWGAEAAFWLMWRTQSAREIGAILGLSVGYVVKYHLDRRFVFVGGAERAA